MNVTCGQAAKFQALELEENIIAGIFHLGLLGCSFFLVFCEARLAFSLEKNTDFL